MSNDSELECDFDTNTTVNSKCNSVGEYAGYLYVFTPLSIIGVVFNTLTLLVFRRFPVPLSNASFIYLLAVSWANLIVCALCIPVGVVRCLPKGTSYQATWKQIYEIYIYLPIANTFGCASVWLTTVVTIERYLVVAHSHTWLGIAVSRPSHPYHAIIAVSISAFAISAPYFFVFVPGEGAPMYTEWGASGGYAVYSWCRLVLTKTIPIILVAMGNGLLVYTLWAARRRRLKLVGPRTPAAAADKSSGDKGRGRDQMSEARITTMLVVISAVFVICEILEPFVHSGVFGSIFGNCSLYSNAYSITLLVANVLEVILFSVNFIIYCIFYRHFTATLKSLCCCSPATDKQSGDLSQTKVQQSGSKKVQSLKTNKVSVAIAATQEEPPQSRSPVPLLRAQEMAQDDIPAHLQPPDTSTPSNPDLDVDLGLSLAAKSSRLSLSEHLSNKSSADLKNEAVIYSTNNGLHTTNSSQESQETFDENLPTAPSEQLWLHTRSTHTYDVIAPALFQNCDLTSF